jgi:hypothetical protein
LGHSDVRDERMPRMKDLCCWEAIGDPILTTTTVLNKPIGGCVPILRNKSRSVLVNGEDSDFKGLRSTIEGSLSLYSWSASSTT